MGIRLNTRWILTKGEDGFENGSWSNKTFIEKETAINIFNDVDWKKAAREFKNIVDNQPTLTFYEVLEAGISFHNKENESELYAGLFEEDYFEVALTTFDNDEMNTFEVSGISKQQVVEIITLYYDKAYDEIREFLEKREYKFPAKIKTILLERDDMQEKVALNTQFMQFAIGIIVLLFLYFLTRFI